MTDSVNLGLPCIEDSQAQKHITHNDALRILDTLVQLAVLDRDLTAPPGAPAEGQRWIVKTGATGAWAGHVNAIAAWQNGAWQFSVAQTGWVAFVAEQGRWYTALPRPLFAFAFVIYVWKVVVWDRVLGLGSTAALSGDVAQWAMIVLTVYFGGRSLEKVARIIARK
jgi:Protein of unknown function (DUF2793)